MATGSSDRVLSRRELAAATGRELAEARVERSASFLEGGRTAVSRLLERGVTGIVRAGGPLALGAVRAARRCGLRVPSDISAVGYDDCAFMNRTEPPLTTVRRPVEAMGRAAVELLRAGIQGGSAPPGEQLFEPELVVRAPTAKAAR